MNKISIFFASALWGAVAFAEAPSVYSDSIGLAESAPRTDVWSYSQCVDYALANNISLRKTRLAERTDAVNISEAEAQWYPTLDFSTSHGFTNYPWRSGQVNNYNSSYGLNAGWTVWDGGVRSKNIKRDKLQLEIDRMNTGNTERTLQTDLLQVYINILYAREAIDIARRAVEISKAQAERTKALMESGRLSRVDYARINSQYEQDVYSLVEAQTTYESRCLELKTLLELHIDSSIAPAEINWTDAEILAQLPPIEQSYLMALGTDLRMRGLELEQKASDLDIEIAKAGRAPKISLQAGVGTGWYAPGDSFGTGLKQAWNEQIGVTLALPIFDQKKTGSAIERARIQQEDAALDLERRKTEVSQIIENWYNDTQSSQARYKAAQASLESARITDELTNEQFALGYVNPVELMNAHNSYIEAQHTLLQAKYMALLGQKMIYFWRNGQVTL